jgi:hypothetical protein
MAVTCASFKYNLTKWFYISRSQCWPHDYFGTSDDEELAAIMRVYGRYIASKKSCNYILLLDFCFLFSCYVRIVILNLFANAQAL